MKRISNIKKMEEEMEAVLPRRFVVSDGEMQGQQLIEL